ncbi:DUF1223 domain-containing protein [Vibrio maerlii]|uniref:DUF1223 domain-containing protein n=1 Tax=Vibrio maerlii TaxID=2231648 RepID=UPI0019CFC532|nr:DUF1223 domain-containing protein [Vibrio maerlii]
MSKSLHHPALFFLLFLIPLLSVSTQAQILVNNGKPAQVIELFTSEGCSSCPPADKYLSQFQKSEALWQDFIPLAYHVDYWDYLGWKDKFASKAFSQKQRLYRAYGVVGSVYTPGFVVDGDEWRGFFRRSALPNPQSKQSPELRLEIKDSTYQVNYQGKGDYIAHIALLAVDRFSAIRSGENRGKKLEHDFVVLHNSHQNGEKQWQFNISNSNLVAEPDAVAVWLTKPNQFTPEQTVAGWLE